jgi:hypothetical protein
VPFGTQFFKISFMHNIPNKISDVKGVISFDSPETFKYQNAIEGQFLFRTKMFFSLFGHF